MMRVHHVGYLVKKPEKAREQFAALGFTVQSGPVYDTIRDVEITFLEKDCCTVELVTPRTDASVVANLMKSRKNSPYHICYASDDFENDIAKLEKAGFVKIDARFPLRLFRTGECAFS